MIHIFILLRSLNNAWAGRDSNPPSVTSTSTQPTTQVERDSVGSPRHSSGATAMMRCSLPLSYPVRARPDACVQYARPAVSFLDAVRLQDIPLDVFWRDRAVLERLDVLLGRVLLCAVRTLVDSGVEGLLKRLRDVHDREDLLGRLTGDLPCEEDLDRDLDIVIVSRVFGFCHLRSPSFVPWFYFIP